MPKNLLFVTSY
jgi:hypothetical protein